MPVFSVKRGNKYSNRPESFVEVVEATTIDFCCASAGPAKKTALPKAAMSASVGFRSESRSVLQHDVLIVLLDLAVPQRIFLSRPSKTYSRTAWLSAYSRCTSIPSASETWTTVQLDQSR